MKFKAIALLSAVILAGCGSDTPSTSDAKDAFLKKTISQSIYGIDYKDCVDLNDFNKTNGLSADVNGVKVYELDYEATLKFKAVCYGNYFPESESLNALSTQKPADPPKWMTNAKPVQTHNIGDTLKIKGKLVFHKTENGWVEGNI
jgi:hypothetical protein